MDALRRAAHRIAGSAASIALSGERGTGKEHFARHLHHLVDAAAPFVRIDCADASDARLAWALAELPARRGSGGTLFLDTLDVLPLGGQQRLTTVLPAARDGQGADASFRVVASLATSLGDAARSGAIGAPLLAGLKLVEISVPALRQRRADIPVLVEYFLDVYSRRHDIAPCRLDRPALVLLWQYDWPGNVRELESVMERLAVLGRGRVIGVADLRALIGSDRWSPPYAGPMPRPVASGPSPWLRPPPG